MKEAASPTPGHRNGLGTQRLGGPALPGGPASTRSRERGRCGGKPAAARLRGGPPSRTSNQQHTPRMSVARVAMGSQALDPRGPAARGIRGGAQMDREPTARSPDDPSPGGPGEPSPGPKGSRDLEWGARTDTEPTGRSQDERSPGGCGEPTPVPKGSHGPGGRVGRRTEIRQHAPRTSAARWT